jgi:kinesin family protein 13
MDDSGHYAPVEIQPRDDVGVGGIFQLRQGQQRRVVIRIRPLPNSGNLPIVCYAISQVEKMWMTTFYHITFAKVQDES